MSEDQKAITAETVERVIQESIIESSRKCVTISTCAKLLVAHLFI